MGLSFHEFMEEVYSSVVGCLFVKLVLRDRNDPIFGRLLPLMDELTKPLMPMDIVEGPNDFEITADLPGFDRSNIDVTVENGMLEIKATRNKTEEKEKGRNHVTERSFGSVHRSVTLPSNVDMDSADLTFNNGVLTITIGKKKDAATAQKKLAIKGN